MPGGDPLRGDEYVAMLTAPAGLDPGAEYCPRCARAYRPLAVEACYDCGVTQISKENADACGVNAKARATAT